MRAILLTFIFLGIPLADVSAKETTERRNALKTTFLSWFSGSCKISYERAVFCNQTMELTAGYIGVGRDKYKNDPKGYTVRYAHKFMLWDHETQPLNGLYLRPELIYSRFRYQAGNAYGRDLSEMGSIVFTIGYQLVIRRFLMDAYFGSGYATGSEADTSYQHGFSLWDYFGACNKHIAMTFGLKLGVCF
jgi:hypothetical protein